MYSTSLFYIGITIEESEFFFSISCIKTKTTMPFNFLIIFFFVYENLFLSLTVSTSSNFHTNYVYLISYMTFRH